MTTPRVQEYIEYRSMDRKRLAELNEKGKGEHEIAEILEVSPVNVSRALKAKNGKDRAKTGASKATVNRELSAMEARKYILIPLQTGRLAIDPIVVRYGGERYATKPIIIIVESNRPSCLSRFEADSVRDLFFFMISTWIFCYGFIWDYTKIFRYFILP